MSRATLHAVADALAALADPTSAVARDKGAVSSLVRRARDDPDFAALFTETDWETAVLHDYDKCVADELQELAQAYPYDADARTREVIVKHLGVPTDTTWRALNDAADAIRKESAARLRQSSGGGSVS